MRVGLISDTHIPEIANSLPGRVREVFEGVDLILHAGDIYVLAVLDELQSMAPVLAARGDDDYGLKDERVQEFHNLNLDGLQLYLTHASEFWSRSLIERPESHGLSQAPDIVVFGHTHRDVVQKVRGSLLVNPGSATFPYYQLRPGTVGILTIEDGKAEACIVELAGPIMTPE